MAETIYTIISRQAAKDKGLKFFYTGTPCKHGHDSTRYVSNNICVECQSKSNKNHWDQNSETLVQQHRKRLEEKRDEYNANRRIKYQTDDTYREKVKSFVHGWYYKNREMILNNEERKQQAKEYRDLNKVVIREQTKKWRKNNRDYVNQKASEYRKNNRAYYNAQWAKYRSAKLQATPPWHEKDEIEQLYEQSNDLTKETGVQHEVDHIVPLQGKNVCGLHCLANLQVLEMSENRKKSNKLTV